VKSKLCLTPTTVHGPGASVQTHLVPGQPRLPRQQVLIGVARVPAERERERGAAAMHTHEKLREKENHSHTTPNTLR